LKNLGVEVDHLFACDVDKNAKATIMANFPPKVFYDDLTIRDNKKAPKASLYVAGFPCQPFSMAGKQEGFADTHGRGTIFFKVREYIVTQSPSVFVLENVKGLLMIQGGQYFDAVMESLRALGKYNISWQVLDTKEHGVPQTRQRVYIVGIKKSLDQGSFAFPEPIPHVSIEKFLEPRKGRPAKTQLPPKRSGTARANVIKVLAKLEKEGQNPFLKPFIMDCDSTYSRMTYKLDATPCMTCGRRSGHWISNRGRRMTTGEMMRLQGMNPDGFVQKVSDQQLGKQIGNAMSVNVLERIFVRLLPAAGLVPASKLQDRWEAAALAAPSTPPRKPAPATQKRTWGALSTGPAAKVARKA